jgi:hypothetical protein
MKNHPVQKAIGISVLAFLAVMFIYAVATSESGVVSEVVQTNATPEPTSVMDLLTWCKKGDVQFTAVPLGNEVLIQNHGDCTFSGSVILNGEYRGAGGLTHPKNVPAPFISDARSAELSSFVHKDSGARFNPFTHSVVKCEVDLRIPRMQVPCGVHIK